VATPTGSRPGRALIALVVLIALMILGIFLTAPASMSVAEKFKPKLGLDLEGGTSITLTPRTTNGGAVTRDALNQAVKILRSRVDAFGVAEAEVAVEGSNIVISIPGKENKDILDQVRQTAELRFRPVLAEAAGVTTPTSTPSPSSTTSGGATPSPSSTATATAASPAPTSSRSIPKALLANPAAGAVKGASTPTPTPKPSATPTSPDQVSTDLQQKYLALDCTDLAKVRETLRAPGGDDPNQPMVTCQEDGSAKFLLGPAEVLGTDVSSASAGLETNSQGAATGGWQVNLKFTGKGTKKFAETTTRLAKNQSPLNQFGIVLDGLLVSAPALNNGPIVGGQAQITGNFTQKTANDLANVLKYGALPLTFDPGQVEEISATLGGDQLHAGLVAGLLGLLVVVVYLFIYYQGLGIVSVSSLMVAGLLTYLSVVFLGHYIGFRLSLAGVAGLIVAIGITADSFIVYFERLRDEVREGRTLRVAVESGWVRARRTILSADAISLLAAVVLYVLSVGSVRGFAFTLGLTTIIDVVVVFLFTKPVVTLLARTKFFGSGHSWSGLSPDRLGTTRRAPSETLLRRPKASVSTRTAATKEA
jgi:preprotein translocase subunit SecD